MYFCDLKMVSGGLIPVNKTTELKTERVSIRLLRQIVCRKKQN